MIFCARLTPCVWKSSRQLLGLKICYEDTQGSLYSCTQSCELLQWRIQIKISKGKRFMRSSLGKSGKRFQESFSNGVTQDKPNFSNNTLTTCVKCCQPEKLVWNPVPCVFIESRYPVFLLGTGQIDSICLMCNKCSYSQKESRYLSYGLCQIV